MQQQRQAMAASDRIMRQAERQPGLLDRYLYMRRALAGPHDRAFTVIFSQYLAWYQTFVGDYAAARSGYALPQPARADDRPSPLHDSRYSARPAADALAKLARGHRAVFFNEAHNVAETRSLTVAMLARLRREGFNTFAAETLYQNDNAALARRGYPTADSGFYTREPVYADMVRTALHLGYRVVAYEATAGPRGGDRETRQARNLYRRTFARHPDTRLVVNAGYAHIVEHGPYLGGRSMAEHFRRISGIDPLTVEQTMLYDRARAQDNHPYYNAITAALKPHRPLVFIRDDGTPWSLRPGYDISVIFPRLRLDLGRPTWLDMDGLRHRYPVSGHLCHGIYPCLIQARPAGEAADAVAADRLLLNPAAAAGTHVVPLSRDLPVTPRGVLYLRPGRYVVTATGPEERHLSRRLVDVADAHAGARP